MKTYSEFLQDKIAVSNAFGFEVHPSRINAGLKPHQRDAVLWALKGGRRALFESFGLGKTIQQLEIMRIIGEEEGGRQLIIAPLGVRQEFRVDAEKFGCSVPAFIRFTDELQGPGLYITNYESVRDGRLDVNQFNAVSLDEASVLRSYGSKTFQEFLTLFAGVKYRFVATATPSPNRYKELIHYAGFLGIMDTGQALTRWFKRDSQKANNLTLYPHKENEFWLWVSSWALFLQKPSDLGYSDEGYDLPKLHVHYHKVKTEWKPTLDRDGQMSMVSDASLSLRDAAREKRDSLAQRIEKLMEVINATCRPGSKEGISQELLSQPQIGNDRRPEEKGFSAHGRGQSIPEGILRGEQADTPEEAEGQKQEKLSGEKAGIQCKRKNGEIQKIRPDGRKIQGTTGMSGRGVCDLRDGDSVREVQRQEGLQGGSLSQDRKSEGPPLHEMQLGLGDVQGFPRPAFKSEGLSDQLVIWCDLNDEQDAIERALKESSVSFTSLRGNQDIEEREEKIQDWKTKKTSAFLSKPIMYGSGVNLQQCHTMIFSGIGFKAQDFLQSIHRIHRFQQDHECHIHIIFADTEEPIMEVLQAKWQRHDEMVERMSEMIREYGLSHTRMAETIKRSIGIERVEFSGLHWKMVNNDSVEECAAMESNSVDLIHTSIPFANHYEYTPSFNDMGHTRDNTHFWEQMDFLTPELLRILRPGRIYACHVKDRILFGNVTEKGVPTVSPFHAETIFHNMKHGFDYLGMITVVTDVVRENNQTYRLGWSEQCKDGTKMGVGSPEYIILLRKPQTDRTRGYADVPVTKSKGDYTRARWQVDAHAFWRSSGDRLLTADELAAMGPDRLAKAFTDHTLKAVYSYEDHIKIGEALEARGALPATFMAIAPGSHHPDVWHDVNRMLTLNGSQARRNVQLHICPLQFDIVDRIITRYSNEGETVFDPFAGIGTVPVRALKLGRKGCGCELNPDSVKDAVVYLDATERDVETLSLFDFKEAMGE